jgi:diguanylate cyclase (GGDEF)-like protein
MEDQLRNLDVDQRLAELRIAIERTLSCEAGNALGQSHHDGHLGLLARRPETRQTCRVLVVDDDILVRARLSALLSASKYDVLMAATGQEALEVLDATHCHVVLTDWQMPIMDGLALCRRIRLRRHESYIYVLILTVRDADLDVMAGLAAGADAYMVKGAPINDILARLEIGRRITYEASHDTTKRRGADGLSSTDSATGAHNLRYLTQHLPRELARSQRHGHSLAVLHCEIDGYDRLQDQLGRDAGDDLLKVLIASIGGRVRQGDWLARTADASLAIILPETAAKGAHCAAHKLRGLFSEHPLSALIEALGVRVRIEVTSVDARHNTQSTAQIDAVMRGAVRGIRPSAGFGEVRPESDAVRYGKVISDPLRGKNELN